MTLRLVCRNLSAGWPGKTLVANFSTELSFSALNDALPIVGRTGRGKSTLLYALSGMSRPETGAITWFLPDDVSWTGDAASFKAVNQVRQRRFGFMLQDAALIPCFTVAENLRHIFDLRRTGAPVGDLVERSIETMLIEGETIGDFLSKYPSQLSGGMRQRMALAAAIVHSPQVLFADEPTASLDDASGLEVLKVVRRWLDDKPGERAFVFVTHRVETLREGAGATSMVRLATETVDRVTRIVPRVVPIQ